MQQYKTILEYIWLDGHSVENLRSKIKVVYSDQPIATISLGEVPEWGFDGSSTNQAKGANSDCILKPAKIITNPPSLGIADYLVLCEVFTTDDIPHPSNYRAALRKINNIFQAQEMWFAVEQEYFICCAKSNRPFKWPEGYPPSQGRYYCGVGGDVAWGRHISETHLKQCLEAGLRISGTNAEVAPAQWEFQIGPGYALSIADELWLARYILNKTAEKSEANINLEPKPIRGDWNGSGAHINFSTKDMREYCPIDIIKSLCSVLETKHLEHLKVYGKYNENRLTGQHETCEYNQFKWGKCDRTASIRIPATTLQNEKGYIEDRRPAANVDPYRAFTILMNTICNASLITKI